LTNQPSPPGAHGQTDGNLALSRGRAREQQVRRVGAGDEQRQRHHRQQREERSREAVALGRKAARKGFQRQMLLEDGPAQVRTRDARRHARPVLLKGQRESGPDGLSTRRIRAPDRPHPLDTILRDPGLAVVGARHPAVIVLVPDIVLHGRRNPQVG
jgi:hypothetical protein